MTSEGGDSKEKLVPIKELPIYGTNLPATNHKFVESDPLPLQQSISCARHYVTNKYAAFAEKFSTVDKTLRTTTKVAVETGEQIKNDYRVLPKAAAITVAGMGAFVLTHRRFGIKKYLAATGAMIATAAFCYPYETIDIVKIGIAHGQRSWEDFKESPEPKKK
ncbi:apolipoprotein O domain-containing protein [Ditylenchus destructor]|nr:apolipoprotein O domain-containing protein [Ditylenchus destructor]